uniref:Uncharacterized protein n=1 Tax=Ciona savignyi TaxID=51511 RepID=H2Z8Y0_CIOSA
NKQCRSNKTNFVIFSKGFLVTGCTAGLQSGGLPHYVFGHQVPNMLHQTAQHVRQVIVQPKAWRHYYSLVFYYFINLRK